MFRDTTGPAGMPIHSVKFVAMLAMISINLTVFFYGALISVPDGWLHSVLAEPTMIGGSMLHREVQLAYVFGAMGFPLFCFALAYNFAWHTRSHGKMIRRFLLLTLAAELARLPALYMIGFWPFHGIFVPMLLGLLVAEAHRRGCLHNGWAVPALLLILAGVSSWLPFAGAFGVLVVYAFYLLSKYDNGPSWALATAAVWLWVAGLGGAFSVLAPYVTAGVMGIIAAARYLRLPNGPRLPKQFWYAFYPGVMLLLAGGGFLIDRAHPEHQLYAYERPSFTQHAEQFVDENWYVLAANWMRGEMSDSARTTRKPVGAEGFTQTPDKVVEVRSEVPMVETRFGPMPLDEAIERGEVREKRGD